MIQPGSTFYASVGSTTFEYLDVLFEQLYYTIQQQIKLFKKGKLRPAENWTYFIDLARDANASVTELCDTPILNSALNFFEEVFVYVGTHGFGSM